MTSQLQLRLPPPGTRAAADTVEGPAGTLELAWSVPAQPLRGLALVAHPHPLYGGALSNKVTYTLANTAAQCGYAALRFNFRGVGGSAGRHDEGRGEADDAVALADALQRLAPGLPLTLLGFSFGGFVLLHAACRLIPEGVLTIAPPLTKYVSLPPPPRPAGRWWLVHSRDDEVVRFAETREAALNYQPPPHLIEMDGAGHFFHGQLSAIQAVVRQFLGE